MGNTQSSKERHDDHSVDHGQLVPFGVYSSGTEYHVQTVVQLIVDRRLAPFYRPLEDFDAAWDDDQILAARKNVPALNADAGGDDTPLPPPPPPPLAPAPSLTGSTLSKFRSKDKHAAAAAAAASEQPSRISEAAVYKGAVECPICLLYYPANINMSRCCDQAICTECFVQIKRAEPTPNHLSSEPAACPYCVRDNFGVVYSPPPWRTGINADHPHARPDLAAKLSSSSTGTKRKSISHTSPEVVTVDMIHPDWEQKLAQVQAAVNRRANRRIIMRQVGDRLIPVGVTSGRVQLMPGQGSVLGDGTGAVLVPEGATIQRQDAANAIRNRGQGRNQDLNQLLGGLGLGGPDIEELMVMEAMRLSLLEHDAQQERQRAEAARNGNGAASTSAAPTSSSAPPALPTINTATPAPSRFSHSHLQGNGNTRELSPTAVQNLASSALGRAALSGALAIGLPPHQQPSGQSHRHNSSVSGTLGLAALGSAFAIGLPHPLAEEPPAAASQAETRSGEPADPLLVAVPVAALADEVPRLTETAAVSTAEPLPTPSASIGDDVNAQLQAPLVPEPATPTAAAAQLKADPAATAAEGSSTAASSATAAAAATTSHTD